MSLLYSVLHKNFPLQIFSPGFWIYLSQPKENRIDMVPYPNTVYGPEGFVLEMTGSLGHDENFMHTKMHDWVRVLHTEITSHVFAISYSKKSFSSGLSCLNNWIVICEKEHGSKWITMDFSQLPLPYMIGSIRSCTGCFKCDD